MKLKHAIAPTAVAPIISLGAWAQLAVAPLAFDVASVKPSAPPSGVMTRVGMSGGPETADPGRITCENMTLRNLVQRAYGLRTSELSAPDWMSLARFDIVATLPPNTTKERARLMWQNLLADRFKLTVHRETKELPLYALVVGSRGLKLTEAPPDDPAAPGSDVRTASGGVSGGSGSASMHMSEEKMTMPMVADFLSRSLDRPVVDETGLTGRYKISLEWQAEDGPASTAEGAASPSIFTAIQEQLVSWVRSSATFGPTASRGRWPY